MGLWNGFVGVVGLTNGSVGVGLRNGFSGFLGLGWVWTRKNEGDDSPVLWALLDERARSWVGWGRDQFWVDQSEIGGGSDWRVDRSEANSPWVDRRSVDRQIRARSVEAHWLSLSLSSPPFACLSPKMVWSENRNVKWFSGQSLYFYSQMKCISGNSIFHAQPNTRFYGKWFPEMVWNQNKQSLSFIEIRID